MQLHITCLLKLGESLYSGQHSLCLTLPCLFYLQRKFSSLQGMGVYMYY